MNSRMNGFLRKYWVVVIPFIIGMATVAITGGYVLTPAQKQVVIKEVGKGQYTISECVLDDVCPVTKVAHTPAMVSAYVWAYLSGQPVRPDWRE